MKRNYLQGTLFEGQLHDTPDLGRHLPPIQCTIFLSAVKGFLENTFPELRGRVSGANYPPPPVATLMMNMLSVLQLFGVLYMVVGGEKLLRLVGFKNQLPRFYYTIQANGVSINQSERFV